jgi:hypothetical protein
LAPRADKRKKERRFGASKARLLPEAQTNVPAFKVKAPPDNEKLAGKGYCAGLNAQSSVKIATTIIRALA